MGLQHASHDSPTGLEEAFIYYFYIFFEIDPGTIRTLSLQRAVLEDPFPTFLTLGVGGVFYLDVTLILANLHVLHLYMAVGATAA